MTIPLFEGKKYFSSTKNNREFSGKIKCLDHFFILRELLSIPGLWDGGDLSQNAGFRSLGISGF